MHKIHSLLTLDKTAPSIIVFILIEAGQEKVNIILPNLVKGTKMRRLLGLAVLSVVLSMSVPSYGYFLIYNVSSTVKGADQLTNAQVTIPFKGYLVLNIADGNNALVDANLILYGKNTSRNNVYVQLNYRGSGELVGADVRYIGKDMFVGFGSKSPYRLEMLMSGRTALKDISLGTSGKKRVAGSIKGVNPVWGGFLLGSDPNQEVSGTANVSATLWAAATRYANANGWTQDQIVLSGDSTKDGLIKILADKGYDSAFAPATDDYYDGVGISVTCIGSGAFGINGYEEIPIGEINTVDINNGGL